MGWGLGRGDGGGRGRLLGNYVGLLKRGAAVAVIMQILVPLCVRSADLGSEMSLAERRGVTEPGLGWDFFVYQRMVSLGLWPPPDPFRPGQ